MPNVFTDGSQQSTPGTIRFDGSWNGNNCGLNFDMRWGYGALTTNTPTCASSDESAGSFSCTISVDRDRTVHFRARGTCFDNCGACPGGPFQGTTSSTKTLADGAQWTAGATASGITETAATIAGTVVPHTNESTGTVNVHYRVQGSGGAFTVVEVQTGLSGTNPVNVSKQITGLVPGTTYEAFLRITRNTANATTSDSSTTTFTTNVSGEPEPPPPEQPPESSIVRPARRRTTSILEAPPPPRRPAADFSAFPNLGAISDVLIRQHLELLWGRVGQLRALIDGGGAAIDYEAFDYDRVRRELEAGGKAPLRLDLLTAPGRALDLPFSCRVYKQVTQSIPDNTTTEVTWDSVRSDPDGMFNKTDDDAAVYTKRAGRYLICAHMGFATNGTGDRAATVRRKGPESGTESDIATQTTKPLAGVASFITVPAIADVSSGTRISVVVLQDSGAALNLLASTELGDTRACDLWVLRLDSLMERGG